jgi:KAP-like P-loop domain-containing protein
MMSRQTRRRYFDLILLAAIGVGVAVLISRLCPASLSKPIVESLAARDWGTVFALSAIIFGALVMMRRLGGLRLGQFHLRMRWYPPVWVAGVAAFCIYWCIECPVPLEATRVWVVLPVAVFAIALILGKGILNHCNLYRIRKKRAKNNKGQVTATDAHSAPLVNQADLMEWINTPEAPIKKPTKNLFSAPHIARRLTRIILRRSQYDAVALTGALGAGKSSVLNLVEYYIKNPKRLLADMTEAERASESQSTDDRPPFPEGNIVICRVSAWGTDGGSASHLILDAALKALQRYVDCTALASVPFNYRQAMQASSSRLLGVIASLLGADADPRNVLSRINQVARTANLRLLVFVEDADRDDPDETRLHAINALLDGLHELRSISFIFALGRGHLNEPLVRLCEHIEPMPDLDREQVAERIAAFREEMLKCYYSKDDNDITVEPSDKRDRRFGELYPRHSVLREFSGILSDERKTPLWALASLLNTPRALKTTLRHTLRAWTSLHGEVSFDDLLCVLALRFGEPNAYSFLANHIDSARRDVDRKEEREKILKERIDEWNERTDAGNRRAAECLLRFLLPGLLDAQERKSDNEHQHIRVHIPTDYWARVNVGAVDGVPDQKVLRGLPYWKSDPCAIVYDDKTFVDNLRTNPAFVNKLRQFEDRAKEWLVASQVYELASELFASILGADGVAAEGDTRAATVLWRIAREAEADLPDNHKKWLRGEIVKALRVSLPFALRIYDYWRNGIPGVEADASTPGLGKDFLDASRDVFQNDAQALANALDPERPYGIDHLVHMHGHQPPEEDWVWLGPVIIDAIHSGTSSIIGETVMLLTDKLPPEQRPPSFKAERAEIFFGDRLPEVAEAILNTPRNVGIHVEGLSTRRRMDAARAWAKFYLESDEPAVAAWRKRQSADPPENERRENSDGAEG